MFNARNQRPYLYNRLGYNIDALCVPIFLQGVNNS